MEQGRERCHHLWSQLWGFVVCFESFGGGRDYEEGKKKNFPESVLSIHHVDSQDQIEPIRLSSKCLCSLSLLASPAHSFKLRITSKVSAYTFRRQSPMGKQILLRGGHWGKPDMSHPNALLPGFWFFWYGAPALNPQHWASGSLSLSLWFSLLSEVQVITALCTQ